MIRVLHLRSTQGLYGADRALLAVARATSAPYFPIVGAVVAPGREDLLGAEAKRLGLAQLTLRSGARADVAAAIELADEVRAEKVSLLHAHDYKSLALALAVGAVHDLPVVATYHGDTATSVKVRAYETFAHLLGNGTRGVAVVSRDLHRTLSRTVFGAPIVRIANGIAAAVPCTEEERLQARRSFGIPDGEQVISVVARLSPEKGVEVLLEAIAGMAKKPRVLIAGDGPLRDRIEEKARVLPVQLLGFRSSLRDVYAAADLVVMPSLTEGLPLVALEAMAHGRPILASAVGELPEVLAAGCGFLVGAGDEVTLAAELSRVLSSKNARDAAALRALERVQTKYGVEAMARAYAERLYAPALAKRATAAKSEVEQGAAAT